MMFLRWRKMLALFWIGIIVIVAIAIFFVANQGRLQPQETPQGLPALERNLFNLEVGDIVQYGGEDWVVEGRLTYYEGGYSWFDYLLQESDRIRWLSVAEDDIVEVAWMESTTALELSGEPPRQITFDGESYRRVGEGVARMSRIGTMRRQPPENCRYFDYEGPGDKVLSVEDWDGELEVSVGRSINPRELSLLPGTGGSVYRS